MKSILSIPCWEKLLLKAFHKCQITSLCNAIQGLVLYDIPILACPKGLFNCLPQSDTEFWDKMQAEWEELARRNWLEDSDSEGLVPPSFSSPEKVFSTNQNALHQWFSTPGLPRGLQQTSKEPWDDLKVFK